VVEQTWSPINDIWISSPQLAQLIVGRMLDMRISATAMTATLSKSVLFYRIFSQRLMYVVPFEYEE